MMISHVRWKFKREKGLVILAVGEGQDLDTEKFIWVDLNNIWIISRLVHGTVIQHKNAFKYKTDKDMKISLSTAISFKNEKDIDKFFWLLNQYF